MGALTHNGESTHTLEGLVYTLLDVFDATRDLHETLTTKEKRDYELQLRSKGYPSSRKLEFIDDNAANGNRAILTDKLALLRRYEDGLRDVGSDFAVGDALSHVSLQAQVIKFQGVLLATFLYGPTSSESIQQQLSKVDAASHAAATTSVDILSALERRQRIEHRTISQSVPEVESDRAPGMPGSFLSDEDHSTALLSYRNPIRVRAGSPANTTVLGKVRHSMTDVDTISVTSYSSRKNTDSLFCSYANDLERHRSQQLCSSITHDPIPSCPYCKRTLHLSPGKAWEVVKSDTGYERCFQISNRFVVKCHRSGPDAGYACILCSKTDELADVAICGDVKALVKHIFEDHNTKELKSEEDITEVVELALGERRRDSGLVHSTSRSSRRSTSVSSRRRGSRPHVYDREVEAIEVNLPRRGV